jgi:hypothetical protein
MQARLRKVSSQQVSRRHTPPEIVSPLADAMRASSMANARTRARCASPGIPDSRAARCATKSRRSSPAAKAVSTRRLGGIDVAMHCGGRIAARRSAST